MPLRLERALKREIDLGGAPYTVTISPLGVRLVRKGFRKGVAVSWRRLLALAVEGRDSEVHVETPAATRAGTPPAADPPSGP